MKKSSIDVLAVTSESFEAAYRALREASVNSGIFFFAAIAIAFAGSLYPSSGIAALSTLLAATFLWIGTLFAFIYGSAAAMNSKLPGSVFSMLTDMQFWKISLGFALCSILPGAIPFTVILLFYPLTHNSLEIIDQGGATDLFSIWPLIAVGLAGIVLAGYFAMRILLVLPALVDGEGFKLTSAWKRSRSNGFRMLACMILVLALIYIVQEFFRMMGTQADAVSVKLFYATSVVIASFLQAVMTGALSGVLLVRLR